LLLSVSVDNFGTRDDSPINRLQRRPFSMENRLVITSLCAAALVYACGPWMHSESASSSTVNHSKLSSTANNHKVPATVATELDLARSGSRVDFALRFIADNLHNPTLVLDNAARATTISKSRLAHLIVSHTGISWSAHLERARIKRAVHLLLNTALSIKEVSAAVGYAHVSSFDRAFHRVHRCRPGAFRRSHSSPSASSDNE